MSYSALEAMIEQPVCERCGQPIQAGDVCWIALRTGVSFIPNGADEDVPEAKWGIDLDWTAELIYHRECFSQMNQK